MPDHSATTALITDGAQGLGLAVAETLLAEGCRRLILVGQDAEDGGKVAQSLQGYAEVMFITANLANIDVVQGVIPAALARFGRISALVNCAASPAHGSILDATTQTWDALMNTNARAPFFLLQDFAKAAIASGHAAVAVNIGSMAAHCGQSDLAPYAASKAALANITRNAAHALTRHRIRVNGINTGWMDGKDDRHDLGGYINPIHVAALASYMLSPDSGVMTGAVVDFDQQVNGAAPA